MKHLYAGTISLILPSIALAQNQGPTLSTLITKIIGYLNQFLVLMIAVAVVFFVYYVIKYFMRPDANRAEGGTYVLFSVIGFFVILSFWGLVNILQNTFGLKNESFRPSSWETFINLFPRGSGGGGGVPRTGGIDDRGARTGGIDDTPITAPPLRL